MSHLPLLQIQDDCTALIKENAALSAQVVELQKQIDMVSQLSAYVYVILGVLLWDDLDQDQDQQCRIAWCIKGTDKWFPRVDSSVSKICTIMLHLIQIIPKECTL